MSLVSIFPFTCEKNDNSSRSLHGENTKEGEKENERERAIQREGMRSTEKMSKWEENELE